jgi:hypothetical protein
VNREWRATKSILAYLSASPGEVREDPEIAADDALLTIVGVGSRVVDVDALAALGGALKPGHNEDLLRSVYDDLARGA